MKVYRYKEKLTPAQYVFFKTISNVLIIIGILFLLLAFGPIVKDEVWYQLKVFKNQNFVVGDKTAQKDSPFARYLTARPINIEPVNREFSIVIEKIGVNAPIKADVSVANQQAYFDALKEGVAHAGVSDYPSKQAGNVYLFAHSSINFWQLGRYASVFNLLRKLETGDRVHVFFKNQEYIYEVVNKETLKGWNTYPLIRPVIEPTLTLQTCDPPGTTLNRLVVTAKLLEVR